MNSSINGTNRRIVLAARPKGAPTLANFRLEEVPIPQPQEGEVLLRTLYMSLDPYMRGRMNAGPSYAAPVEIGGVMEAGAVSRVELSRSPLLQEGDLVVGRTGWQEWAAVSPNIVMRLPAEISRPSYALGVLGMPGLTAYVGLLDIGKPKAGETVVVAAATGAVGSAVGQIAKIKGCRAVGIAGGTEKCRFAVEELGFDTCIDHRDPDMPQKLAAACPQGIDVYFENVGGAVLRVVVPLLNDFARVPVCGLISQYNASSLPEGPDRTGILMSTILVKRVNVRGFIVRDHEDRYPEFLRDMSTWLRTGRIKTREDIVVGLENAPQALLGLLEGKNFGKVIVKMGNQVPE